MTDLLKNRNDRYPWEELRIGFGWMLFVGLPMAAAIDEGMALLPVFTVLMICYIAFVLIFWKWPV